MPQITIRRAALALGLAVLLSVSGVLAGYTTGLQIVLRTTEPKLGRYADSILMRGEASSLESRNVLQKLNEAPPDPCSDKELAFLRELAFRSEYLKELARIRDGKIVCSALLGRPSKPLQLPQPLFTQKDGTQLYKNIPLFTSSRAPFLALRHKEAMVVFRAHTLTVVDSPNFHYIVDVPPDATQRPVSVIGGQLNIDSRLLSHDGQGRADGFLYATRCSKRFFNCLTAYTSVHEVKRNNNISMTAFTTMGGLTGFGFGCAVALFYFRQKSPRQQLQKAIRDDAFHLVYQPLVHLPTGTITGAEALVRWTDTAGYSHNPEDFVKLAEDTGLICKLTERVVNRAIQEMTPLLKSSRGFKLNLNISAEDLNSPGFASMLKQQLEKAGIPPGCIGLELTERSTARGSNATQAILTLRSAGYSILIDDFGTGYSSLSYLHELAVDAIKIDGSFTSAITTKAVIGSILPQILEMVRSLNLDVVIEGIENDEQASYFRTNFPEAYAQGWLFGKPVSAADFGESYGPALKAKLVEEA